MSTIRSVVLLVGISILLGPASALAQSPPGCVILCEPQFTSTPYQQGTMPARPLPRNGRGGSSMLASSAAGSGGSTLAGSESYNQVIPILSLPGRNGLDVDLALFYSSRVWTIDSANNRVTFNADRDFPSYGFRLGYGYIEVGDFVAILTEPDGTKRRMLNNVTVDSSYIDWNTSTKILRRKDGTQWHYQQVGTSNLYRPIKIQDTNGNFISITYKPEATSASRPFTRSPTRWGE